MKKRTMQQRWTAGEVAIVTWSERDRSMVAIQDRATEAYLVEWWDEDAEQLFEDGFFKRGRGFERSVVEYADHLGITPTPKRR